MQARVKMDFEEVRVALGNDKASSSCIEQAC